MNENDYNPIPPPLPRNMRQCKTCNGKGTIPNPDERSTLAVIPCRMCGGSGWIYE